MSSTPFALIAEAPPIIADCAILVMIPVPCSGSFSSAWQETLILPLIILKNSLFSGTTLDPFFLLMKYRFRRFCAWERRLFLFFEIKIHRTLHSFAVASHFLNHKILYPFLQRNKIHWIQTALSNWDLRIFLIFDLYAQCSRKIIIWRCFIFTLSRDKKFFITRSWTTECALTVPMVLPAVFHPE